MSWRIIIFTYKVVLRFSAELSDDRERPSHAVHYLPGRLSNALFSVSRGAESVTELDD